MLYATQFTRHLDKHGYVRFRNWRFFGEDGLAGEEVSVWVYEDTLKVEYQTTSLSLYSLIFQPDHEQIAAVTNHRRFQTPFRSPQLDLWQLSETEWLLALRRPAPAPRRRNARQDRRSGAATPVARGERDWIKVCLFYRLTTPAHLMGTHLYMVSLSTPSSS